MTHKSFYDNHFTSKNTYNDYNMVTNIERQLTWLLLLHEPLFKNKLSRFFKSFMKHHDKFEWYNMYCFT